MPTVPVYIRKADYEKWLALEKPAQFVSDALNSGAQTVSQRLQPAGKTGFDLNRTPIQDIPNTIGTNLCKIHGTPKTAYGKCLMKGCKYA